MYTEISAAISSVRHLGELLKAAKSLSNFNELVAAVSEVNAKLVDAQGVALVDAQGVALASQEKQSVLVTRIAELELKLRELEQFEREAGRYELVKLPLGALVFGMKRGMENGQPEHYLCATCMDKRQITRLQPNGKTFLKCPNGHQDLRIANTPMPQVRSSEWPDRSER